MYAFDDDDGSHDDDDDKYIVIHARPTKVSNK